MLIGETTADRIARHKAGIVKFAWFPRMLDDGRYVWLQKFIRRRTGDGNWPSRPVYRNELP